MSLETHFGRSPAATPERSRVRRFSRDYTESLERRVEELERRNQTLERYAAAAAHELVEPLVMTEAYAAILTARLSTIEHADCRRDLDTLSRGAARSRLVAESLLHEARSGSRPLHLERVDVAELVHDCLALLRPEIRARRVRVEVHELPDVEAEEALLSAVFSNLFVNALKYTPREGAGISVGGTREDGVCRYHVDSEGRTIPVEDRLRIFEAYQRGSGERRAAGAGIGLAICWTIVERHGGEIGVEPAPGRGNRFHFTIPDRRPQLS